MWEIVGSIVATFLSIVLIFLQRKSSRQEEAERRENEALERIEKTNHAIASGDVDAVSSNIDRAMADIDAHDRLLSSSTDTTRRQVNKSKK